MGFLTNLNSWLQGRPPYRALGGDEDLDEGVEPACGEGTTRANSKSIQDPRAYWFSPLQQWVTPLMRHIQKTDFFEADDLPAFSRDSRFLRPLLTPLIRGDLVAFLCQRHIARNLLIGGVLELLSSLCALSGPILLRQLLQEANTRNVVLLFSLNVLGTLSGRSKDQLCRVQSTLIASMLKSGLYHKCLRLSVNSLEAFPPGTIINISSHDVAFLRNYFLKVHDIWSSMLQITIIFLLVLWIMGRTCLIAFLAMFLLFASQSKANFRAKTSSLACDKANDERLRHFRDFLYNVKAVKVQSLEDRFTRKIKECRERQLLWLRTWLRLTFCLFASLNQMIPAITATIAFVAYWWSGHELRVDVVFPVLALFDMMYQPAAKLSISVTRQFSVLPSFRRIMSLLTAEEYPKAKLPEPVDQEDAITLENAEITYTQEEAGRSDHLQDPNDGFVLGPLNGSIPKNKLTIVIGPIGSGKSTLLLAITGQIRPKTPQSLRVRGSIALAEQDPWIQSASVRENIVFLSEWDEVRYRTTVQACCLEQDFARWPAGDRTRIGEKGTNVSGGQRARISLARAVYSEADIILLDDPLAAVDAYVGNQLFYNCIRKLKKTVVLVTHQTQFVSSADNVIRLLHGKAVDSKTPGIVSDGKSYSQVSSSDGMQADTKSRKDAADDNFIKVIDFSEGDSVPVETAEVLHKEEDRATGRVNPDVYLWYFDAAGGKKFLVSLLAVFGFSLVVRVCTNYWFVWWLNDSFGLKSSIYMLGYVVLTLVQAGSLASVGMFSVSGSLRASHRIHATIMANLFHAPLFYYESQPIGRVLNRLSSDFDSMDFSLMNAVDGLFNAGGQIIASSIMIIVTAPLLLVVLIPLSWFAYQIQFIYRASARELRRVSAILNSPVITILSEALNATSTIKAYQAESYFLGLYDAHLNRSTSASIMRDSLDTWVTARAELLSALIVLSCGSFYVLDLLPPVQAGLALSTAIMFTKNIYLLLWALIQVEVEMNSVERLQHYTKNIPQEVDQEDYALPSAWPQRGEIQFQNVVYKYRSQNELALDHINLKLSPGEKIGLVGRTGSGKTTLVSSLSRLHDISSGIITIDGVEIQQAPLSRLRDSVYVLPQEPLLLEGTLRENLDFGGQLSDSLLWNAIQLCGLDDCFQNPDTQDRSYGTFSGSRGLDTQISFRGANLSAGQTQLVCMARAMLLKPKVLIIDEATASVDPQSDRLIQNALQTQFPDTTMLCVAHRLETLVWMDRIVVMENGQIVEQGSPRMLLEQDGSGELGESRYRKLMRVNGDEFLEKMVTKVKKLDR